MIYHTVTITQVMDKWVVEFKDGSDVDREPTDTVPNPQGFYHFPSTETKTEALTKLVVCMSNAHLDEMERLDRSMQGLVGLSMEIAQGKWL